MTWSDPTTRSTGDLITAAIWNQDAVDNPQFLHDRVAVMFVPSPEGTASIGDYSGSSSANPVRMPFVVPDDFESISEAVIHVISDVTTTYTYDLTSDYHAPGGTENYNNHSESLTSQSLAVSANKSYEIDVSGVLSSLAAGDLAAVAIDKVSGTNTQYVIGFTLKYTRT